MRRVVNKPSHVRIYASEFYSWLLCKRAWGYKHIRDHKEGYGPPADRIGKIPG